MKYLFAFTLILASIAGFSQNDNLLPERAGYKLKLAVDEKSVYEMDVPSSPYVRNQNIVQLYPGETVFLEATIQDSVLILSSVKEIKHPEKTITVSFIQNESKKVHQGMMLKVSNPFNRDLTYDAHIYLMNTNRWVPTSIIPVRAGLSSFEMWPDVIITIGLGNWKL